MELKRRKLQGVLNILSFNRHFYFIGLTVLLVFIFLHSFFGWPTFLLWLVLLAFVYGFIIPLLVSAYVYDLSGFYQFNWLPGFLFINKKPKRIVNINAGFDETSFILEDKFPSATIQVYDFYNAERHTEPAIKRARKVSWVYPNTTSIDTAKIPEPSNSVDTIFLLSAVHEIRDHDEKIQFLKECNRILNEQGQLIIVEHLRDFPNFLAFTVGFTHFFSRQTWKNAVNAAGFQQIEEKKFTAFMSVFTCTK